MSEDEGVKIKLLDIGRERAHLIVPSTARGLKTFRGTEFSCLLERKGLDAHPSSRASNGQTIARTVWINGQAHLVVHLGVGQDDAQRLPRPLTGARSSGHGLVVAPGRLHVDAHPIDEARAQQLRQAAVRLEDVTPDSDPEELQAIVDYLHSENVPFQMAVVPKYVDPKGTENNGTPKELTLEDSPELVAVLQDAVKKGGTIIQHGTTHQFGTLDNPYNAVSADDFEFIRSWCSATNDTKAPPIDCQDKSFVQIGGTLPGTSQEWASERVDQGRQIFGEVGLPTPEIFETPHYSATREAYYGIGEHYPVRYERELLYAGTLTNTQAGPHDYYGQFFPYAVNDPYGTHVLPENLGNFEPNEINQHPPRLAQEVIDAAKLNLVNTHATASFFFHPYYPLAELKKIVTGIKAEGYTFVPASELK